MPKASVISEARASAVRGSVIWAVVVSSVMGLPAAVMLGVALYDGRPWWEPFWTWRGVVALVLFAWALFGTWTAVVDALFFGTICPYFEREVGDIDTFARGRHLARWLGELDDLAARLGVTPFSRYGFADDLRGETLVWHDPAEGLAVVESLLAGLDQSDVPERDRPRLAADLRRVAHALSKARDKGIRFCLMHRPDNVTSGQEWEVRKGTVF